MGPRAAGGLGMSGVGLGCRGLVGLIGLGRRRMVRFGRGIGWAEVVRVF